MFAQIANCSAQFNNAVYTCSAYSFLLRLTTIKGSFLNNQSNTFKKAYGATHYSLPYLGFKGCIYILNKAFGYTISPQGQQMIDIVTALAFVNNLAHEFMHVDEVKEYMPAKSVESHHYIPVMGDHVDSDVGAVCLN
ncbi:hypothetical protein phytr_11380 [Candidatus Phycorickettsia trachydisci]|uniref:Uncharacterized protein n=1 Tax=Candidatus Phycorickettsia trachydisci TaxID=2115978 RepID=A0A2P1P9W7_9RICK|nr:hypothetical protein [Candidatus Phycorickettsia trachydisci]AVP88063.1 hypothetical protein phytr_11380 [Candidatus Phycorickettsia trachydisci]